jgi:hypothetical protein
LLVAAHIDFAEKDAPLPPAEPVFLLAGVDAFALRCATLAEIAGDLRAHGVRTNSDHEAAIASIDAHLRLRQERVAKQVVFR